jgi:predicted phosphoribosyltransferase/dienelactone hydrolase
MGILAGIMTEQQMKERHVTILESLEGGLTIPLGAQAVVLFAHGSGSSRYSSRNKLIATVLNNNGIATLLVDLLSQDEKRIDEETKHLRYNIELLAGRFAAITNWLAQQPETRHLKVGYFGSSTGAAAALIAASRLGSAKAIVTRGGRPDLASESALHQVRASTLLIVGGNDTPVIAMNKRASESLSNTGTKELAIIPGAGHLFEEPGKMEEVAQLAANWFECYLLRTGKRKFYNKYASITIKGFLSSLWNRHAFQIKFKDRFAAGEILSSILGKYKNDRDSVTVIGIARGGVIVADPIAEKLNADFDIIVPRKLRSPHNSENAIGAIMHDGSLYLDRSTLQTQDHKISNEYIEMEKSEQKKEMEHRLSIYRPYSREYKITDRTVILVDDGIATGATMIAAAKWIRKQEPKQLIIAAPIAPKRALELLKNEVDHVEIIRKPSGLKAVEQFYQEFASVSDDQILQVAKRRFVS